MTAQPVDLLPFEQIVWQMDWVGMGGVLGLLVVIGLLIGAIDR